jgi:hypothetical protein
MCGTSSAENTVSDEQNAFYKQLTSQYSTIFGENQSIMNNLTAAYTPILQAGPGQEGYSTAELNNMRTGATESTSNAYAQSAKATAEKMAAEGGGNNYLPSGVSSQIQANQATAAAQANATAQQNITAQDYATGRSNWLQAANVLGSTAAGLSPTAYSSSATGAGSAASTTATTMQQQALSPWNSAIGAAGSILGGSGPIATGIAKQLF